MSEVAGAGEALVDFPTFLQHYAHATGLGHASNRNDDTKNGKEDQVALLWVPGVAGQWREVDHATMTELIKSAAPYSTQTQAGSSSSEMEAELQSHLLQHGSNLWVRSNDGQIFCYLRV